ncbi:hypothetical protein EW145_g5094 [Phellinidium pouzarii]|uniref:Cytochrome P450 n=1 Tax=Phellinidium pouzarii TaxID=167371 RepID=A0A4S4L195_9AGAM|nr:hypothetical protein EW145_g5094 [Phellinidium pouzarii]
MVGLVISLGVAYLAKVIVTSVLRLQRGFANLGFCPGRNCLWFNPSGAAALLLGKSFPPRGWQGHYNGRFSLYAKEGSTILSSLLVWSATPVFWLADAEAIKTVTSDRHAFIKDLSIYEPVDIYGKSLVSTEGAEWRRHLAIAAPAFSDANYALTWKETLRVVHEWFSDEVDVNEVSGKIDVKAKMKQATLHVIAAAGFGMSTPWAAFQHLARAPDIMREVSTAGSIFPFHTSLDLTIKRLLPQILVPRFLFALPFRVPWISEQLETVKLAFTSLEVHMSELAKAARRDGVNQVEHDDGDDLGVGADLLRRLVQANDAAKASDPSIKKTLTDGELFINMTTVIPACRAWFKKKLREETMRVWPTLDDLDSSTFKRDFDKLEYTLAFFHETLRCLPAETRLLKLCDSDTILYGTRFVPGSVIREPESSFDGAHTNVQFMRDETSEKKFPVTVPKGSNIMLDFWAVQMNPLTWGPDVHIFRPERFIDTDVYKWPRDGFLAFSGGARGCIGKRFASVESVCLLASLVRRYEVLPVEDARKFASQEEFKRHMLTWSAGLTIGPMNVFVKLRRLDNV